MLKNRWIVRSLEDEEGAEDWESEEGGEEESACVVDGRIGIKGNRRTNGECGGDHGCHNKPRRVLDR